MKPEIYSIIRQSLIDSYNAQLESEKLTYEYRNKRKIGKEITDYRAPRVNKVIEFVNPKTGRLNHKTLKNQYQTYVFTQEMYDNEMKCISINTDCTHHYQVNPDDSVRVIGCANSLNPTVKDIERVYDAYGNLAEHLVGFEIAYYKYYGENGPATYSKVNPIFDEETNIKFWAQLKNYMDAKFEWCQKYGSN